jgi:hypothetical protein
MARRLPAVLKVLALAVLVGVGWKLWDDFFGEDEAVKRLVNQLWIERMPRNERDQVQAGLLIEHDGERFGVVGRGSQWRWAQEAFLWRLDQDRLRTRFPQDDKRYTVQVRTWECEGKAPEPFELCLELRRGGQVLRFFSKREWVIRPRSEGPPPREIEGLVPSWESLSQSAAGQEVGEGPESDGWGMFERRL